MSVLEADLFRVVITDTVVAKRRYSLAPDAPNIDTAEGFGKDLYAARVDPSDHEDCFNFLFDLYPNRLREVIEHLPRAMYEAGQLYIEAEMARKAS